MSTVADTALGDIAPCWHCHGPTAPSYSDDGVQVMCVKCGVRGPLFTTDLEATQAWNAVRLFGRVGVVHGIAGMPNYTTAAAEHLRLAAENVAAGVYNDPAAFFIGLVYPAGRAVHVITHRLDRASVVSAAANIASSGKVELSLARHRR